MRIGESHGNRVRPLAWAHVVDTGLVALEALKNGERIGCKKLIVSKAFGLDIVS